MAEVTIDSSGRYVPRRRQDQTKSQPEAIPVEERPVSSGDVALSGVQDDQQGKAGNVLEVRGEA